MAELPQSNVRSELRAEAKRLYVDATYSSRGHFQEAKGWSHWSVLLGLPLVIVTAASAAGAATAAILTNNSALTAGLALTAAVLTSVRGFLRPEESAQAHGVKAARYAALAREAVFFLKIDTSSALPDQELVQRLRALRQAYADLTLTAPHLISPGAYEAARRGVARGEANYEDDPLSKELERADGLHD